MVKEYIEKLMQEEKDEMEKLHIRMKKALDDLQSSQKWLEDLQRENNMEINIFSPRKFDVNANEKIEEAKAAVREHDHNVEYIRKLIENHTKRTEEYEKIREENEVERKQAEIMSAPENEIEKTITEKENEEKNIEENVKGENAAKNKEEAIKEDQITEEKITAEIIKEEIKKETIESETAEENNIENTIKEDRKTDVEKTEVISFLKNLYKETEISLALLNGDKNKCRNGLKNMMREIKKYVSDLEKE